MKQGRPESAAFLRGDRARVAEIRAAVQTVVRSFQFPDGELDRDLVQDALSRIIQNLSAGRFRGDASLETYAQKVAKYTCLEHLRRAHHLVLFEEPPELLALELREALEQLGEMVGAVYTDDLLDRIFSRFCIGK